VSRFDDVRGAHDRIERELVGERAAALRRIAERLEALLAELTRCQEQWHASAGGERAAAAQTHRAVRAEVRLYRWYLEVQREALGLRRHDRLDEVYRVPEPLEG
jgi:hypothetical protein